MCTPGPRTSRKEGFIMRASDDDRVRVARVRVEREDGIHHEIPGCWISVNPLKNRVGVWLAQDDPAPLMVLSLEQVAIEWREVEPEPTPS